MFPSVRVGCLILAASAICHHPAMAQSSVSVAAEFAVGGAAWNGGDYVDRDVGGWRLGASIRVRRNASIAAYAELSREWLGRSEHLLYCKIAHDGGCVPWFPALSGFSATGGIIARPAAAAEFRAGIGGGSYATDDRAHPTTIAALGQIDAGFFPLPHVGLVIGGRAIVLPSFRGDGLSILPVTLGVRIR